MAPVPPQYDVIVVGAGVIGLYTAYTMVRKGLRVLLLEQFQLPHKRGSSGCASRIIRTYYEGEPFEMVQEAYKSWHELEKVSGEELLKITGSLSIYDGEANLRKLNAAAHMMEQLGLPHNVLTSLEMKQQFPMFNLPKHSRGLLDPNAGCLSSARCNRVLLSEFLKHGGKLKDGEKVTKVIPGEVVTVVTDRGQYSTTNVALSQGPWTKDLLLSLGVDIPVTILPATPCYWKEKVPGSHSNAAGMPLFNQMVEINGKPQFFYGMPSAEYPGMVKVATRGDINLPQINPDDRDVDRQRRDNIIKQLSDYIGQYLPGLDPSKPSIAEDCVYTLTPDGHYIIDRHPNYPNILIGTGGAAHGYRLAPVIGKLLMEMASGVVTSHNLTPFRIARFKPAAKM